MSAIACPSCRKPVALTPDGPTKCPHCGSAFPVFAPPAAPRQPDKPVTPQPSDPFQPPAVPKPVVPSAPTASSAAPVPPTAPAKPATRSAPAPAESIVPEQASGGKRTRRNRRSVTVQVPTSGAILDFFDLSFQKYLTPVIVKITWVVTLVMAGILLTLSLLAALVPDGGGQTRQSTSSSVTFERFEQQAQRISSNQGTIVAMLRFATWLTGIVSVFIGCLWIRVGLECVIVFFNISSTLTDIKQDLKSRPDL